MTPRLGEARGLVALSLLLSLAFLACFGEGLWGQGFADATLWWQAGIGRHPWLPDLAWPQVDYSSLQLHQPGDAWLSRSWWAGEAPLWQTANGLGSPLAANAQAGVFHPLKALLRGEVAGPAVLLFWCSRWCVMAAGLCLLGRSLGWRWGTVGVVAWLGLTCGALATTFPLPSGHALMAMPWVMWLAHRWRQAPEARHAALWGGAVGGCAWLGHAESALLVAASGLLTALALGPPDRPLPLRAWASQVSVMVVMAILVSAPAWLPFLAQWPEQVSYLQDRKASVMGHALAHWSLAKGLVQSAASLLWPFAGSEPTMFNVHVGLPALLTLPLLGRTWARPATRLGGTLLAAYLLSLLSFAPTSPWSLPLSPNSFYAAPWASWGLLLCFGDALEALRQGASGRSLRWTGGLLAAVLSLACWVPVPPPEVRLDTRPWLAMEAGAAAALGLGAARLPGPALAAALAGCALIHTTAFFRLAYPTRPLGGLPLSTEPPLPAQARFTASPGLVPPNFALAHPGWRQLEFMDAWIPRRYEAYMQLLGAGPLGTKRCVHLPEAEARPWLDLAAVSHRLTPPGPFGQAFVAEARPSALALGRWVGPSEAMPPGLAAQSQRLLEDPQRWRDHLLVELPPGSPWRGWGQAHGEGQARCLLDQNQQQRWSVTANRPGWLVVAEGHAAGWEAWVDGQRAPLVPAYLAFRAVPLPAGDHLVEFRYELPGLRLGLLLALLGLVLGLVLRFTPLGGGPSSAPLPR